MEIDNAKEHHTAPDSGASRHRVFGHGKRFRLPVAGAERQRHRQCLRRFGCCRRKCQHHFLQPGRHDQDLQDARFRSAWPSSRPASSSTTTAPARRRFSNTGDGGDGGGSGIVPNMYLSWQVAPDWYVGLGIGAPFGLKTEYNTPWLGSAHSNSFDIKTMNINPSVAWRANEWLSLGAGVSWQRMDASTSKATCRGSAASSAGCGTVPQLSVQYRSKLEMSTMTSWNWNIGALFTPAAKTKIGVVLSFDDKYTLSGDVISAVRVAVAGRRCPAMPRPKSSCLTPSSSASRRVLAITGKCSATFRGRVGAAFRKSISFAHLVLLPAVRRADSRNQVQRYVAFCARCQLQAERGSQASRRYRLRQHAGARRRVSSDLVAGQ